MKQYIADAFTDRLFGGNPAAVLSCREMPPTGLMHAIAIENNYSETAFVVKTGPGQYNLKWFTPGGEVDLCGHATLATAFVLHRFADPGITEMHFQTLSGELIVHAGNDGYTLDFPTGRFKPIPVSEDILAATGGLAQEAWYEEGDMIVLVSSEADLEKYKPDYGTICRLDGRGLVLTAPSTEFDFVSRCFYPKLDIPEDPVTGSAHTYLTPIWAERLGKRSMVARQISRRGGLLKVSLEGDRVFITGNAVLFMEGDIPFDL